MIALLPADSPNAVQLSLELLRKIQGQVEPIKELVAPLLGTLGSFHGEVRYEAKMYILSLSDSEIKSILLQGIIKTLQFNPERIVKHAIFIYRLCSKVYHNSVKILPIMLDKLRRSKF